MAKTYQYSLRFAIDPYNWDTVKEAKLIDFCKQGQIDNVVFFINPEELNQGHPTLAKCGNISCQRLSQLRNVWRKWTSRPV